jgi:uncharacterized membrane protein
MKSKNYIKNPNAKRVIYPEKKSNTKLVRGIIDSFIVTVLTCSFLGMISVFVVTFLDILYQELSNPFSLIILLILVTLAGIVGGVIRVLKFHNERNKE